LPIFDPKAYRFIMRGFCFPMLGILLFAAPLRADPHVVQKFDGRTSMATPVFTVGDKWEVTWECPAPLRITLLSADGTIVAGSMGVFRGALYQPKGGSYYLQIDGGTTGMTPPWQVIVKETGDASTADATVPPGEPGAYFVPPVVQTPAGTPGAPTTDTASVAKPAAAPILPPAAVPAPPPITSLTEDQARAVVMIEGDNSEGTGFLVKMPDGPVVVTNLHVLAANPHLRVTTNTGMEIPILGMKGASDRDLALLQIKDNNYNYLDLDKDVSSNVSPGDPVITPGNSQGGEVVLNTHGSVVAVGPDRVEVSNPIYHGNSGGPVFDSKNGQVLAVVTQATKVDTDDELSKSSLASRDSAITGSMRYFGLRLDTVPEWQTYDPAQYQTETTFLDQFHAQTRRLDSYLNSSDKTDSEASKRGDENAAPDSTLYLTDDGIVKARSDFIQSVSGADAAGRLDAVRRWLFSMDNIADTNVDGADNPNNFYSFEQKRAREEVAYRKALKKELDTVGDDVSRAESLGGHN
jgi:hypothetical protein